MSQDQLPASTQPNIVTDDDVLAYTRGIRVKVVQTLMRPDANGNEVPDENSDRILLTNMLNGLDSQAMNNKKIAADQKNNDNTAAAIAEVLRALNPEAIFQNRNSGQVIDVEARVVPLTVPDMAQVPGELDVSPPQLDYASFVRSQGKDVDQIGKDVKHAESEDDDIP